MATLDKDDFDALAQLIRVTMDASLDQKLEEKLNEKIGPLPTKDEFFTETLKILSGQEKIHPEYKHRTNVN